MRKSILYIGSLTEASNSYKRFSTLKTMGYVVNGVDVDQFIYGSLFEKFHYHLNIGPGIFALNSAVLKAVKAYVPEILWVDNKSYLTKASFKFIKQHWPAIKIINLLTDDPTGRYKRSWRLSLKTVPYFDIHFVQRKVNIEELKSYGAKRVEICYRSYDPLFHRPIVLNADDKKKFNTAIGFVGTHEANREADIVYLIKNGIRVSITGNDWQNAQQWDIIKPFYKGPSVYGEDYIKTINGMDIALHFLRHANRDEQDSRTFEIPACGVFMLAEKSTVHVSLFKENEEAVFFTTKEELLEKATYYLQAAVERKTIAAKGLERCKSSAYDHRSRLGDVLQIIEIL